MTITVGYESVDSYGRVSRRKFKTLKGASAYARGMIGDYPEFGPFYAVSGDGIGKITVSGATLAELFPAPEPADVPMPPDNDWYERGDEAHGYATRTPADYIPWEDDCPF